MPRNSHGFTLVEALVVLAAIATISSTAIPAFGRIMHAQQLTSASNRLVGAFILARTEAIKRRTAVLIESTDDDWSNGWSVYADLDGNGSQDSGEPLLLQVADLPGGLKIQGNSPVRRYIRYTPDGSAKFQGGGFQAGTLNICDQAGELPARQLILSATGRVRRNKAPTSACP
ncbi:GspH/FimT family pseudopilin [Pseudomonas sp. N040]|uniref:GspH/FimT family pseudopilin n=1 Tax=Pseudomonas sp. N040 TaxID=2785325 RepID=UPI0018A25FD7|nr:GspH/FimT family pseudopilin [Pseudomonas sp. N040]MBF7730239.1 GspH/FimT family pseudopilin [Pseudomonas sp. N040]MBW7013881.1 GspH/FimT family pseudopilin [Pseudomonas sp. N040]